ATQRDIRSGYHHRELHSPRRVPVRDVVLLGASKAVLRAGRFRPALPPAAYSASIRVHPRERNAALPERRGIYFRTLVGVGRARKTNGSRSRARGRVPVDGAARSAGPLAQRAGDRARSTPAAIFPGRRPRRQGPRTRV